MLHLIGNPISTCTKRVLLVLRELDLENEFTLYKPDVMAGEHKKPEHVAKQPFGVVPVLEDGDFRVFESRAICRYLALKYFDKGGSKLIADPKDLKAYGLFEQWASVELTNYDAHVTTLVGQSLFGRIRGIEPNQPVVEFTKQQLSAKLDIYEKILANQKYMAGDEFSIIDIFYMPYTNHLFECGHSALIDTRPNVKAWWERVSARPSWSKDFDPEGSAWWASVVKSLNQ